jgi:membrane-bound metal-dependent hydrolase YbcI (DUF457 family)
LRYVVHGVVKMPFTPFHLGLGLLIGMLLFSYVDFASIMISSIAVDVEPFLIVMFRLHLPLHGFFHSYLGGTIIAFLTAVAIHLLRGLLAKFLVWFRIRPESSFKRSLCTSLFGVYFHILLDSFLYGEMNPFYPLTGNPFLGFLSSSTVYEFCTFSLIFGFILYVYKFILKQSAN